MGPRRRSLLREALGFKERKPAGSRLGFRNRGVACSNHAGGKRPFKRHLAAICRFGRGSLRPRGVGLWPPPVWRSVPAHLFSFHSYPVLMRYYSLVLLVVLSCGCLCSTEPEVYSVTSYGNGSTVTSVVSHTTSTTVRKTLSSASSPTSSTLAVVVLSSTTQAVVAEHLSSSTSADGGLCVDSDGRLDTDVKGSVEYGGGVYVDYCVGDTISEYYCDDGVLKVIEIICGMGCSGGRCGGSLSSTTKGIL